jgi:hypothetical protein
MRPVVKERRTGLTVVGIVVGVALAGMVVAGCGKTSEAGRSDCCAPPAPTRPASVVVPDGWKTATDGKVAISVPDAWAVEHDTNCPAAEAPGTLLLGYPKILESCPDEPTDLSVVTVIDHRVDSIPGTAQAKEKPVMINGVPVDVGFGSPSERQWSVPTLGIMITGVGPLAPRIVATLRRSEDSSAREIRGVDRWA